MSNISISVEVKAPELAVAILALAGAFAGNHQTPSVQTMQNPVVSGSTEPKKENTVENKPEPEKTDNQNTKEGTNTTVEIPTVVDLRAKAQEKGKTAEGKKAIKALLDVFESKSISEVPEEKRVEFMAALEAL